MKNIVLASASPRRKEILQSLGLPFTVMLSGFDEASVCEKEPERLCEKTAEQKAAAAVKSLLKKRQLEKDTLVIAADTLVFKGIKVFTKPSSAEEAEKMLAFYSGSFHNVITCLYAMDIKSGAVFKEKSVSSVFFKKLSCFEIGQYLKTGEWEDAAGGYKIQGKASLFIEKIEGSYSGIIGLPLHLLYKILTENNISVL